MEIVRTPTAACGIKSSVLFPIRFGRWARESRTYQSYRKVCGFHADTPVQYAVGMDHLLDQIPYLEAKRIKQRLLMTYGKNKFYQFKRKERTFSPEDQQYIRQVFRAYGVEDEPVFDAWQSGYRWTKG